MEVQRSLQKKATRLLPSMDMKPSTVIIAVALTEKDAVTKKDTHDHLNQEDYLWIKGHARISARRVHQIYEDEIDPAYPYILKYDGKPVNLDVSVGTLNTYGNNLVVFEAENLPCVDRGGEHTPTPPPHQSAYGAYGGYEESEDEEGDEEEAKEEEKNTQAPPPHRPPISIYSGQPLSLKDPNPRLRPTPITSKPTVPSNHGGKVLPAPALPQDHNPPHIRPTPSGAPTPNQAHADPASSLSYPQQQRPPAPSAPLVKVELGNFPKFCAAWLDQYRNYFPNETHAQLCTRLWSRWLVTSDSERARYTIVTETASVDTEATPRGIIDPSPAQQTPATSIATPPPMSVHQLEDQGFKHFQLSAMLKDATPQVLESAVEASVKLLDSLRAPLAEKMAGSPDAQHWMQAIDNLKKQAAKTKTVIGVVGNTGAGKSSVINAILDEERLVPTNCMRACTAVVTEISYNDEQHQYCAEIEFITSQDWAKELKVLFQDLLDGDGNVSRECTNEDSDAGVAYAKIKAVYPHKTKEEIANSSIDEMLDEVAQILGTSRNIKEDDSLMFYKKLQGFVDSKEKSTGKKDKDGKKQKKEREFWPLIRVVRLYVKSPALATGAVIVDLPGVHDANAARAAVAEGYMKQCTGLWIVAPINRAVDDKAAKSLLGESFKRQLKMDGGFSAVTFICSKTDDISISEAQDSLGLDEQMVPSWEELDRLTAKQKALEKQLKEYKDTRDVYEDIANDVDEQIEVWEALQESVNNGKATYPPKAKSKKRKTTSKERSSRKKERKAASDDEDDDDFVEKDTDDSASDSEEEPSKDDSEDQEPLTEDRVTAKLQELKTTKKDARTQKREITEKMQGVQKELKETREAVSKINSEMSALCISGRNQYSKGAIQQDFAAGIKELDQEIAAEADEEQFNPENDIRDYDEVAKSLPVFCVSSRGYQKLQGRFRKDPAVPGFTMVEETEIPALQAHCEKLTETGRAANCRAFINKMSSLLNSLTIWASYDGTGANLTVEQKAKETRYLQRGIDNLETRLEKATKACARELHDELQENIFEQCDAGVQAAVFASVDTAAQWGSAVNRGNRAEGGLFWSTYKAICRREGVFKNGQGSHDWNAQLTEPMIKLIAPGWEKVFSRKIQSVMNNFTQMVPAVLKKFHRDIEDRARKVGTSVAQLSILTQQVRLCEQSIKDLAGEIQRVIIARQKDINREFVPVIQRAMDPSYAWCDAEVGAGQFKRMKAHMTEHVERNRQTMFQASADEVQRQLKAMVHDVEELLADKIDSVFMAVKRDYGNLLGGGVPQGQVLPRLQRQVRREINKTIDGVERVMQKIIGVEVEASDDEVGTEEDEDGVSELGHDGKEAATTDGHGQGSAASDVKHVSTETAPKLQSANSTVNGPGVEGAHVQSMNGAVEEEHSADDANSVDDGNVEEEEADGEIQLDDA